MVFLQVQNLNKSFLHRGENQVVFSDLNFKLEKRQFVTLLGPSGCGKSTLLRILGGLEKASAGSIQDLSKKKSFVFQEPRLLPWRTCLENTFLPAEIQKGPLPLDQALSLLRKLGLDEAIHKFPAELSGGMKMRASLARSLMIQPDFLLLDEPFSALDESTRQRLQSELRMLFEINDWNVLFVTHSIEEACFLSDRILIFSRDKKGLREHVSNLPPSRTSGLRSEQAFFKETTLLRKIYESEFSS